MRFWILPIILTICVIPFKAQAETGSLAWWFLPEVSDDLPHEVEEDSVGAWTELWERPTFDSDVQPNTIMEQALGAKWVGLAPDKAGKPSVVYVALAGKLIVEFKGEAARSGTMDDEKIHWSDGTKSPLYAFRKRHRRRGRSTVIKFEKMNLPPLASKTKILPVWSAESLDLFLTKLSGGTEKMTPRDLSAVAQIENANGGLLNFKYSNDCDFKDRQKIEDALASIEPKLTCWMSQNTTSGSRLLAALLQKPTISCRPRAPMTQEHCGMASLPLVEGFFPAHLQISLALNRCQDELGFTLTHEIFHLAGLTDKPEDMLSATQDSEACSGFPATLDFENQGEGFLNDFQVQTRMMIFRKVRDEAEHWGWTEGEKSYLLGVICARMGDKYCSRNFFQKAAESPLPGTVSLPEGGDVTWASLAQYQFFDSISEDIQRMHELVKYLHRDSNGALLRRIEAGVHRLHEFFVARQALEAVLDNKRVCSSETDEHVLCEDLAQIVKTPWFRNP